eukprot:scaffold88007_cov69-Cyclotella_meneghiniana.AAC.1
MSRLSSFRPIDPPTTEVSVGTSDPQSHAARAAADRASVMMSVASNPTSTHPANHSQEYLDFMAQCGFTNKRVKKSRDGVFRHFLGQGINAKHHKDWLNSSERRTTHVTLHHFKPCLRDAV